MKKVYEIIKYLEQTNSRNEKINILEKYKDNEMFRKVIKYTYDYKMQYKMTSDKLPHGKPLNTLMPITVDDVFNFLDKISKKDGISDKEKYQFADMICTLGKEVEYIFKRIIDKDLKCGINDKTIIKVFGEEFIPIFNVMLAEYCVKLKDGKLYPIEDLHKFFNGIEDEKVFVNYKYDGTRCIAEIDIESKKITLWSRNGRIYNLPFLIERLKNDLNWEFLKQYKKVILDGEITVGIGNFQKIMTLARRKCLKPYQYKLIESVRYWMFDIVIDNNYKIPLYERIRVLNNVKKENSKTVRIVKYWESEKSEIKVYNMLKRALSKGYEGLMLKSINAPYIKDRSRYWCKVKEEDTIDCEIVTMIEGTGKNKGRLGALVCEYLDNNGKKVRCKVGNGFTDEDRDIFWKNRADMIGKVVEVKFQEHTSDKNLRFPVFIRIREDKS